MRKFAVVLLPEKQLLSSILEMQGVLSDLGASFILTNQAYPHMTLAGGSSTDLNDVLLAISRCRTSLVSLKLESTGIGIFATERPLLYLRWPFDPKFIFFRNQLSAQNPWISQDLFTAYEYWLPKTSLAGFDTEWERLPLYYEAIAQLATPLIGWFGKMAVIDYSEGNEVLVFEQNLGSPK